MTSTLRALLDGCRIGSAMEYLNSRYAEISTRLIGRQQLIQGAGLIVDDQELAGLWMANNDARNYVLLGDPAVRCLRATDDGSVEDT